MITYYVYCHTNLSNAKKYFGITSQPPHQRWGAGGRKYKNNDHFWAAIQLYGWLEGFSHEILYSNLTKAQAGKIEQELIAQYSTRDPNFGYNIAAGGEGNSKFLTEADRYASLQQSRTKAREKQRSDPERHEELKNYSKNYYLEHRDEWWFIEQRQAGALCYRESLIASPEKKRAYDQRKAAEKRRARQDHEKRQIMNERTAELHNRVKQLRKQLQGLDAMYPEVLSNEEKYNLMAANRCRSIKYLTTLELKFGENTNGKNNERR